VTTTPTDTTRADGRPEGDNTPMLDEHLEQVIQWKLAGLSDRQIADQLGIHNSTVSRFVKKPLFQKALHDAHRELMQAAVRRVESATGPALNTLLRAMHPDTPDVPWNVRVQAANSIFRLLGVDRMAQAMEGIGESIGESVRATMLEKVEAMEARVIETTAAEPEAAPALTAVRS
jgi:predicted XRE-type DNA-binding protein